LHSGAIVDTWTFTKAPPTEQIKTPPGVYTTVAVDPAGDRIEVLPHLGGSIHGVAMIISRFADRFPPSTQLDLSWIRST
jgi:hypothetical protein